MTDAEMLKGAADQMRRWAYESQSGSASTHQVDPLRKLADRIDECVPNKRRSMLRAVAAQLRQWAAESRVGGWSTHQVDPMRKFADRIDEHLLRSQSFEHRRWDPYPS